MTRLLLASCTLLALLATAPAALAHGLAPFSTARAASLRAELPGAWCGSVRTTDDTRHQVDNGSARYHAVLAVPADAPERLRALAPEIQAGAFDASQLLEQTYRRAIRFDLGTDCGPQYLDITVVRMGLDSAALAAVAQRDTGSLDAVYDALAVAGLPVSRPSDPDPPRRDVNYVVWLDGPGPQGACGQATLYPDARRHPENRNNLGGSVAVVFRQGDGFCNGDTVRHEIGHTLGAAQPGAAPHADAGGHCTDAYEDTMCAESARQVGGQSYQGEFFDYGNDDYWDPPRGRPLGWWTANLSRFLCPDAACNRTGPRAQVRMRRAGRHWRVTVQASSTARVAVSCRRGTRAVIARASVRTRTLRIACPSRPTTRVYAISSRAAG
jgi:hypothetical protein